MEKETNKFHALQLFTDTFAAETVHLTNEAIGIYIRLLCFAWTKNTKPFKTESAYRICQCRSEECESMVDLVLEEFFQLVKSNISLENQIEIPYDQWTHKRLTKEHEYLTSKYNKKSESGRIGANKRWQKSANGKTMAPIPIPSPIPKGNIYSLSFEKLWESLNIKRGPKFRAFKEFNKIDGSIGLSIEDLIIIYNKQQSGVEDKFVPHFSTWLSQRRWEINENDQKHQESSATLRTKMEKIGYTFRHSEDRFDFFKKDGQEYKIDRYDKEHMIHKVE